MFFHSFFVVETFINYCCLIKIMAKKKNKEGSLTTNKLIILLIFLIMTISIIGFSAFQGGIVLTGSDSWLQNTNAQMIKIGRAHV